MEESSQVNRLLSWMKRKRFFSGNEDVVTRNLPEQSVGALSNNLPRELDNDHIQGGFLFLQALVLLRSHTLSMKTSLFF